MLSNKALVVTGAFVGCSGIILTLVMCRAMNRSVVHVLMGGFGEGSSTAKKQAATPGTEQGTVQQVSAEDVVDLLTDARSVIVVPGYGMVSLLQYTEHASCGWWLVQILGFSDSASHFVTTFLTFRPWRRPSTRLRI
jgi:NAD/NADP transhydrogenase beta subunit